MPTLFIFGGLPATGKSTLASALTRRQGACLVRIDTIEQAMRDSGLVVDGPAGYVVGYGLALDNLRLGSSVVADSVNPLTITREAWKGVARQAQVADVEIEVVCSDPGEHRRRVESRQTDIPGLKLPRWQEVLDREYDEWVTEHIVLDTAGQTIDESIAALFNRLAPVNPR